MAHSTALRRGIKRAVVLLALGLLTSIVVAWAIALITPVPMYPRHTIGIFARWDYAWQIAASSRFGETEVWWMRFEDSKSHAQEAAELLQSNLVPNDDQTVRNQPFGWGTFACEQPPGQPKSPDSLTRLQQSQVTFMGSDNAFGLPFPCLWDQTTGLAIGNTTQRR